MELIRTNHSAGHAKFMAQPVMSFLLLFACLLAMPCVAGALSSDEVFQKALKSTVSVDVIDASGKYSTVGSGETLSSGEVVTSRSLVEKASGIMVNFNGKEYPAKIKKIDISIDFCLLSVPGLPSIPAAIESAREQKVGEKVYAVGVSKSREPAISEVTIVGLYLELGGPTIRISPSPPSQINGGGLFDANGRLIGILQAPGQNVSYVLPMVLMDKLLQGSRSELSTPSWREWIEKAEDLEEGEDWTGALKHAQEWVKAAPKDPQAWFYLGCAYANTQQLAKSIEPLQKSVLINPEYFLAWYELGASYIEINKPEKAIEALQESLRIVPGNYASWYKLGLAFSNNNQTDKAVEAYKSLVSIDPENSQAWYNLGVLYNKAGNKRKSEEVYNKLRSLDRKMSVKFINEITNKQ